jgi:hypothetical protein
MARLEYATMEKQGLRKLRRISAEVHAECKSVLDHLMENRQERKIRDKLIRLHFGVSDTGRWKCRNSSPQESQNREMKNAEILKAEDNFRNRELKCRNTSPQESQNHEMPKFRKQETILETGS